MNTHKKTWLVVGILSFGITAMLILSATNIRSQSNNPQQKRVRVLKAERELTQTDSRNNQAPKRKTLREVGQERDVEISIPELEGNMEYSNLSSLAKASTAIVVAEVNREESSFDGDDNIITSYSIDVQRVLKDTTSTIILGPNDARPLPLTSPLKVVRSGGTVKVNGHKVSAKLKGSELLKEGKQYVFFLRWSPAFNSYHLMGGSSGAFLVKDGRITPLGSEKELKLTHNGKDLETFISEVLNLRD